MRTFPGPVNLFFFFFFFSESRTFTQHRRLERATRRPTMHCKLIPIATFPIFYATCRCQRSRLAALAQVESSLHKEPGLACAIVAAAFAEATTGFPNRRMSLLNSGFLKLPNRSRNQSLRGHKDAPRFVHTYNEQNLEFVIIPHYYLPMSNGFYTFRIRISKHNNANPI